ncbi:ABC transporter ATP-binding protein [soil metagenome]
MLEATGLRKTYGSREVVRGLSIGVARGEILALLGPNGAGKSTTVSMICGLVTPDRGEVRIDGLPIGATADPSSDRQSRARIGLVPQDVALYEDYPALANLELFGSLYGLRGDDLRRRARAVLETVGLSDRAKDLPSTFSGGMKRRLNIACALVHDPDLLIFDEPTVGVDPQSRHAIFDQLEALRARGKAIIYATHYMEEAERLADRVLIVDHGASVAEGTVLELRNQLPMSDLITVEVDAPVDTAELLSALAPDGVKTAAQAGDSLEVGLESLTTGMPALLDWLARRSVGVRRLSSTRVSLEDVFMARTGHQLRD